MREIIRDISSAIGALEDQGMECCLNIDWITPERARVRCNVSSRGVGLVRADLGDSGALGFLLANLEALVAVDLSVQQSERKQRAML